MMHGELYLQESHLFSDRTNTLTGVVSTAIFFIKALDATNGKAEDYKLVAMDHGDFEAWKLDYHYDPQEVGGFTPLLVAEEQSIASGGIVRFIQNTYLDPAQPKKINEISEFLEGPIPED